MPAQSEAQRRYLNMRFGHKWVKKHGFDNKGKLPAHKKDKSKGQDEMVRRFMKRRKRSGQEARR